MSAIESGVRLPYPGLRSFQRDESDLFFGREGSVNDMINRLRPNHFLAVLGTSGSGKSSLVRIGLLDGLELGLLAEAGSSWKIVDFAPGAAPLRNLAREMARLSGGTSEIDVDMLEAFLARGPRSVVEWCQDGHLKRGQNLLILVDQFEELFRYQDYAERQAAEAFVALLIESARSREVPVYVVITMRSEYLGACALIEGLAEAINDGQYLTPRLRREECREAIVGPAAVSGTVVEDDLINRLLNDLEDFAPWDDRDSADQLDRLVRRADQLPLLQHTLNRLWLRADAQRTDKSQPIVLRLADYDSIGGLRGAINAHAEEILASLGPERLGRAEQVFRALTDGKSIATAVRRPTRFGDLVAVADGDEAGTRAVVDAFRETGVNFLRPDTSVPLDDDTIVDISHESLIRQWRRLSGWLQEEARVAQEWTRLGEAAARFRRGEGARYHGQDLHFWREHERPTAAWARRYNQPYDETLAFLDDSFAAGKRQRQMRWAGIAAALIVVVGFGGGGLVLSTLLNQNSALVQAQNEAQAALLQAQAAEQQAAIEAQNAALQADKATAAQAAAEAAGEELTRLISEAKGVFQTSFDSGVGEYQANGDWTAAGALLGSLLEQTGEGSGAARTYDPEILEAVRYRLAAQSAFPEWPVLNPGTPLQLHTLGMQRDGRFALSQPEGSTSLIRLVDRLTGLVVDERALPDGVSPEPGARHLVTDDGGDAVIVATTGEVFHWTVASGEISSLGKLSDAPSAIQALAFDRDTGRLAVLLGEEDSSLQILPEHETGTWLTSIPWEESEASTQNRDIPAIANGKAVGFWGDGYLVSFDDGEDTSLPRYFGFVSPDLDTGVLLGANLLEALPTPDKRFVLAASIQPCSTTGAGRALRLTDSTGRLADAVEPSCLGSFTDPQAEFSPLVPLRAYLSSPVSGTSIANVVAGPAGEGYRLTLDDEHNGAVARLTADLVEDGGQLRLAPGADGAPPLALAWSGDVRVFETAPFIREWSGVSSVDGGASIPVLRDGAVVAEVTAVALGGGPDAPRFAISEAAGWTEQMESDFQSVLVAGNDASLFVVAGGLGGFRGPDGTVALTAVTPAASCGLGSEDRLEVARLAQWSQTQPVFIGIDVAGRVLRVTRSSAGSGVGGGSQGAAAAAGLLADCIGQVRDGADAILLPDPDNERVVVATTPLELRVLPISVQTDVQFQSAQRISLDAPVAAASLAAGSAVRLATADRTGAVSLHGGTAAPVGRSSVVPDPVAVAIADDRLLVVGSSGDAVLMDTTTATLSPIAAGPVPQDANDFAIEADDTISATVAGARWRLSLPALAPLEDLARVAEASAGSLTDPSDQALVALGARLVRGNASESAAADTAWPEDARCYLATDALIAAWQAEDSDASMTSPRMTEARTAAVEACSSSTSPTAAFGQRLADTPHFVGAGVDAWPEAWSALLANALSGNDLALRALAAGLNNASDPFANAAGAALVASPSAAGVVFAPDQFEGSDNAAVPPDVAAAVLDRADAYQPEVQELLGTLAARSGSDEASLREAWLRYRVAEILYRASVGRTADADRTAERRAGLVRALPSLALLDVWDEASRWRGVAAMEPAEVEYAPDSEAPAGRFAADATRLASLPEGERQPLLEAFLWLRAAEASASAGDPDASANYSRFIASLDQARSVGMDSAVAAELTEAGRDLIARATAGDFGPGASAAAITPFMLSAVEPEQVMPVEEPALRSYASTLDAIRDAVSAGDVDQATLDSLRFATRRFDHGFTPNDDTREAARAALEARLALVETLLALQPRRADWLAARGTTRFWIGLALYSYGSAERTENLTAAVRDLTEARAIAGPAFPIESLYWLAEARRWMPLVNNPNYVNLVRGGMEDFAKVRAAFNDGTWVSPPLTETELVASQAELAGLLTEGEAQLIERENDDGPGLDQGLARLALDTLYHLSLWDDLRKEAVASGTTWSSITPGLTPATGKIVGVLGGRLGIHAADAPAADACDIAASSPTDPLRRAPRVDVLDAEAAVTACQPLWEASPDDVRLTYLAGRALAAAAPSGSDGVDLLDGAAKQNYVAAFDTLTGLVNSRTLASYDGSYQLIEAFNDRAVQYSVPVIEALRARAFTPNHRAGLAWLASRAGAFGSIEGQLLAAEFAEDPAEKAYDQEVAARLAEEAGDDDRALEIRNEIDPDYYVDASDRADDEWEVQVPAELPAGLIDELRKASN